MNVAFDSTISVTLLVTVILAVLGWIHTRNHKVNVHFEHLGERVDRQDLRVTRIEQALDGLPGRDETHKIELSLSEMRGDLKQIGAAMDGNAKIMSRLEAVVTRQEDHLLKRGS